MGTWNQGTAAATQGTKINDECKFRAAHRKMCGILVHFIIL
jgi:hypothetical protein